MYKNFLQNSERKQHHTCPTLVIVALDLCPLVLGSRLQHVGNAVQHVQARQRPRVGVQGRQLYLGGGRGHYLKNGLNTLDVVTTHCHNLKISAYLICMTLN